MYIERIILGIIVLALVVAGQQYGRRGRATIKWVCYIFAAVLWGAAQYFLKSDWIAMLISIAGIELFAWLIGEFLQSKRRSK